MKDQLVTYLKEEISMDDNSISEIISHFIPLKTKRNEIVEKEGQVCKHFYFINKGCLRLYEIDKKGNEITAYFSFEHTFITALTSFITQKPSRDFLISLEPSELLKIDRNIFFKLLESYPKFKQSYYKLIEFVTQHLRLCRLLRKYDQGLINYDLLYLFFIVIFPFTASGLFVHVESGFTLPLFLYSFNLAAVAVVHLLILRYVLYKRPALSVASQEKEKKYMYVRAIYASGVMVALFLLIILVAIFTHNDPSLMSVTYLLTPFGLRFAGRKSRKYKP